MFFLDKSEQYSWGRVSQTWSVEAHTVQRSKVTAPVWVYHGCAGDLCPAGQVKDVASMWCVHRSRHIDISRQFSNESNAALEGELLFTGGEINVTWRSFGISIGVQMQHFCLFLWDLKYSLLTLPLPLIIAYGLSVPRWLNTEQEYWAYIMKSPLTSRENTVSGTTL